MLYPCDIQVDSITNPTVLQVTLWWSKTDTFGAGVTIHSGRSDDILCKVKAVLAYLAVHPATSGPLFLLSSGVPMVRQFLWLPFANTSHHVVWTLQGLIGAVSRSVRQRLHLRLVYLTQQFSCWKGGSHQLLPPTCDLRPNLGFCIVTFAQPPVTFSFMYVYHSVNTFHHFLQFHSYCLLNNVIHYTSSVCAIPL